MTDPALMNDLSNDLPLLDLEIDNLPQASPQDDSANAHDPDSTIQISKEEPKDNQNVDQDVPMSGVGAGPLPTGFGVQLPPSVGSTLTEFTKRRNWSQQVVEELKDFLYILTPDARIMWASPSAKALTDHDPSDLTGKFIQAFIHNDDHATFLREFNESIASGNALRFFYRFKKLDGSYTIFECHGHPHFSSEQTAGFSSAGAQGVSFCRGFFMMARPYPTKNASLLDSFLEHKIENERLKRRITDLKREEQDEIQQPRQHVPNVPEAPPAAPDRRTSFGSNEAPAVPASPNQYNGMPPPNKPSLSTTALTSGNLSEALAASAPDSINDKMARYEGLPTHYEGIEMLTGLRYREGERSKGISTGAASPTLVRGDQGIEFPADSEGKPISAASPANGRDNWSGDPEKDTERRRKMKVADEYVCTDCGTLDSPEWRRGPQGPKTLCNACGLRWAKKEKKRSAPSINTNHRGNSNSAGGGGESGNTPTSANLVLNASTQPHAGGVPTFAPVSAGAGGLDGMPGQQQAMQMGQPGPGNAMPMAATNAAGQPLTPLTATSPMGNFQNMSMSPVAGTSPQANLQQKRPYPSFPSGGMSGQHGL